MAKQIIPEELDALIQEYLTDGIITDKERQVLLNKASKLGLDVNEVDLYIDAQQQKADQTADAASRKRRGKTCPFCGGSVPQLADKCPHCGQFITVEADDDLKEIIENLEESLVDLKSGKDFEKSKATAERYLRKAKLYYSNNPKVKILVEEVNNEIALASKNVISNKRKQFVLSHLIHIIFGVIVLVEVIIAVYNKMIANARLSDYHNYIGNRSDMYDQYSSASGTFALMVFVIIITIVAWIAIAVKKNKKD